MEQCSVGMDETPTELLMQGVEDLVTDDSYQLAQCDGHLPTSWIILNIGSTVNVILNCSLLKNVHETNHYMCICCRWSYTNLMGELHGYPGDIWYNPHGGIANILSMADVCDHFCVWFDSSKEWAFLVKKPDGMTKCFIQLKAGLYFHDTAIKDTPTVYDDTQETMLLTTVADKKSKYMARMYSQALLACKLLQAMIGYPSTHDFLQIVDCQLLPNCPITRADILATEDILGPNVHSLKGRTVQQTKPHVSTLVTPVPPDILSLYRSITLCVDIMFVNKMPFLVTIS